MRWRRAIVAGIFLIAGIAAVSWGIRALRNNLDDAAHHDRVEATVIEKRIETVRTTKHSSSIPEINLGWLDSRRQPHSGWIAVSASDYDADQPGQTELVYVSRRDPDVAWLESSGQGASIGVDWIAIVLGSLATLAGGAGAIGALLKSSG